MSFIVAIDGPAGSGKGTVTKRVAEELDLINIDTGAMYRCVALEMIKNNILIEERDKIEEMLKTINIEISENGDVFLNKENVTKRIRENDVNNLVSPIAVIDIIRTTMGEMQRKMSEGNNVIMEGRDIGTTVFPNADVKIYLDASAEERAKRRLLQNKESGISASYEEVLNNIIDRDKRDSTRKISPLRKAEDAILIDSSNLTIEEVVQRVCEIIKSKMK